MRTKPLIAAAAGGLAALCIAGGAHAQLTVSSGSTNGVTCSSGVCTTTIAKATLNVTQLQNLLASSDIQLKPGSLSKDIVIAAGVFWSSSHRLTLDGYRSIAIDQPVQVTGTGALTMTTDDGGTGGTLTYAQKASIAFLSLSSSLIVNGTTFTLKNSIASLASAIAASPAGNFALAGSYDAKQDGTYAASPIPTTFEGTFDGLNNTISNLTIDAPDTVKQVGLFQTTFDVSVIRNLKLSGLNLKSAGVGNVMVGGLIAWSQADDGFVINVSVDGTVSVPKGSADVGGLIGNSEATIDHCRSSAKVTSGDAGGLVGLSSGTITNSTATGAVNVSGNGGGLLGLNDGTVSLSSASAKVNGKHGALVGGLVGVNNGGEVDTSFATGKIQATGNGAGVGGLVGVNNGGDISNSYATGATTGSGDVSDVGGLVGTNSGTISQAYSTGEVTGLNGAFAGGSIGDDLTQGKGTIQDDYWDTTTSGITNPDQGAGTPLKDKGITALSDSQLKSGLPSGFDKKIWAEKTKINGGLPYLIANPPKK